MSRYRRFNTANSSYFFTVVTYRRRPILCDQPIRNALRKAIAKVRATRPFVIDAWVLLPDHLHCIWTLPEGDADFSTRWMMIKRAVSRSEEHTSELQSRLHLVCRLLLEKKKKKKKNKINKAKKKTNKKNKQ